MKKISKEDALEIAVGYRKASVALGDYRFAHWNDMTPAARREMEDKEWDLLNQANLMVTGAVGIAIDEAELAVKTLKDHVEKGSKVLANIDTAKNGLKLAGTLLVLAFAISTSNPAAIVPAAKDLYDAIKDMTNPKED